MELSPAYSAIFERGGRENIKFWQRLGEKPDFRGKRVLDLGCAQGRMCVDVALDGAKEVAGIDIGKSYITFAQENLERNFPHLQNTIQFHLCELNDYDGGDFDYILSKDTFEHIQDLPGTLQQVARRLKPGGKLYTGFGPLWNSPFGDHGRLMLRVPWAHIIIPDKLLVRIFNAISSKQKIDKLRDLHMNTLSYAKYRHIFAECGLDTKYLETNRGSNVFIRLFRLLNKLPLLKEYFTCNLYCIMERTDS